MNEPEFDLGTYYPIFGYLALLLIFAVATLILACLSIEARVLFFGPEKPVETRKLYFYMVALTCIVLAGGWLLGVLL